MSVVGIAAEYNPFHLGHAYQLSCVRENGADAVVAVMSGWFVQRGECALLDKFTRAETAVRCGVDLVVGLPVSYSVASAERFASGCVEILSALGCVDSMNFGSECGDLDRLIALADTVQSVSPEEMAAAMDGGKSYARAMGDLLRERGAGELSLPNDILAVEYIKAIRAQRSSLRPDTLKRLGSFHGSDVPEGYRGAESIRDVLRKNPYAGLGNLMPSEAVKMYERERQKGRAPVSMQALERCVLAFLRTADPASLSGRLGVTEGLEYRLCECAMQATGLDDLYARVKTKRYAMSTVRRAVLSCFLGLPAERRSVPYVQVLAFNEKGAELLRTVKKTCALPVLYALTPEAAADPVTGPFVREECRAADLYALAQPVCGRAYGEFTHKTELVR